MILQLPTNTNNNTNTNKNDHCEKPDDTLLKKEKRILDNIISSYNDTKGALDDTITNLIG